MASLTAISERLANWKKSLSPRISLQALFAGNKVVYKWKAPFRSMVLREATFWRTHDLLDQSYELHTRHRALGARILLRSALETVSVLVHLNQITAQVLEGSLGFYQFSEKTSRLLLGSRDQTTKRQAVNIATVLGTHCEKRYPGISNLYASLSETAHPNFEGVCFGYSRVDFESHVSEFSNYMCSMYEEGHASAIELCIAVFEHEYFVIWPMQFKLLEEWIQANDDALSASKDKVEE